LIDWPPTAASSNATPNWAVGEFELIERIRRRARQSDSVLLGIGDDAAVIQPAPGKAVVATTDALVLDRHFTADWPADDIGHLALHANLSDLAAMGATPRWALLALTLPEADETWLDGFLDGFLAAADETGVVLVGGNISAGPLNICVQLLGEVTPGEEATRNGAEVDDLLVVTGTLGDAAAALALKDRAPPALQARLHRPEARIRAGQVLAAHAHALIDISDGLLADLGHLLEGRLGARVNLDRLPVSDALLTGVPDVLERWRLQAGGGNDYELLAVLPPMGELDLERLSVEAGVPLTVIGEIDDSARLRCFDAEGSELAELAPGWDHFPP
jgi:thiamine-monophosphate kinase